MNLRDLLNAEQEQPGHLQKSGPYRLAELMFPGIGQRWNALLGDPISFMGNTVNNLVPTVEEHRDWVAKGMPDEHTYAQKIWNGALFALTTTKPSYGITHRPSGSEGAPAHDLTGGGKVYPDDVYSAKGPQYYGHYGQNHPMDVETFSVLSSLRGKPNAKITIYRAVPEGTSDALNRLYRQKAQYMARGIVPKEWGGSRKSLGDGTGFYDFVTKEIARLEAQPVAQKLAINPGDWVTVNRRYAVEHGQSSLDGKFKILSKTVRAKDIFTNGDSIHEWGYDPQP